MVKLAAFPKCYMDELCVTRSMTVFEWIDIAATLPVDGVEMYDRFLTEATPGYLRRVRTALEDKGLAMPMMCYSPDFTIPEADARRKEIDRQKRVMEVTAELGGKYCRVLSGQRRPEVSREQGLTWVVEAIEALIPHAERLGLTLTLENHYKDNYWQHPEFAQSSEVFREILARVPSPTLAVNYDPSNAILAGEDPIELLRKVKHRVVTMHASDRSIKPGYTLDDLRAQEDSTGYASILQHGEIGHGLNDFDAIFSILRGAGFDGWISIEDGVNGLDELRRSAEFLRGKMARYWPEAE
ncbi:MAG: sugar phosphate isomerase/epimerase [Chloroflexota bacterium]|nr:sugar phosphate isomerase/epimerase [Chloroflexota bacterium]MDQ5867657.1 sugar phosphate isomerase/epimerase [Chloroflexota bacterium]